MVQSSSGKNLVAGITVTLDSDLNRLIEFYHFEDLELNKRKSDGEEIDYLKIIISGTKEQKSLAVKNITDGRICLYSAPFDNFYHEFVTTILFEDLFDLTFYGHLILSSIDKNGGKILGKLNLLAHEPIEPKKWNYNFDNKKTVLDFYNIEKFKLWLIGVERRNEDY